MLIKNMMMTAIVVVLFALPTCGQDCKIVDSLTSLLVHQKSGMGRFTILYQLTFQYIQKDNLRALELIREAEAVALLTGDSLSIVKSRRVKGELLCFLGGLEEAHNTFEHVLRIAVRNDFKREVLNIKYSLGKSYLYTGNYDKALELYFSSRLLALELGESQTHAFLLNSIGIVYYKLKNYRKGLNYFKQALATQEYSPFESFIVLSNMSLAAAHLQDFSDARKYAAKSLENCGADCPENFRMFIDYAFGVIFLGERYLKQAEQYFLRSYSGAVRFNNMRYQLDNIYLLVEIYIDQNDVQKAHNYLAKAEAVLDKQPTYNLEMIKIYSRFSEFYINNRDFEKAAFYQTKYIQLKDSIFSEEMTTNLMKTEAEFLERENRAIIDAQRENLFLKEESIRRKDMLNMVIGILAVVLTAFLVLLFRSFRHRNRLNILLAKKVRERTFELECNRDDLRKAIALKDLRIDHTCKEVSQGIKTIHGLCLIAPKEILDPVALSYIEKIKKTNSMLVDVVDHCAAGQ